MFVFRPKDSRCSLDGGTLDTIGQLDTWHSKAAEAL